MSTGIQRTIIPLFCDDFGAKRRVIREVRRYLSWDHESRGFPRVNLVGCEFVAYFLLVNIPRHPVMYIIGLPFATFLYTLLAWQILFRR